MITVNGVVLPTPSDYSVAIQDLSKGERNANGLMIMERIATKRKIELAWKYLSQSELAAVLNAVSPVFFTVTYIDPQAGGNKTGTFYSGDRNVPALDFIDGNIRYKDIKFNLIER